MSSWFDNEAIISSDDTEFGKNIKIGDNVKFCGKVIIGDNCIIEDNVIIGYNNLTKLREGYKENPTIIKDNVRIRSGSIIYMGCIISLNCHIGHNVVLREFTKIGNNSSLGTGVVCEGYTTIGHHTTIHAQTHLTAKMSIGSYVFVGPKVSTMNDRKIRYYRSNIKNSEDCGPVIGDGVAVGGGAIILPKVIIQIGAVVAAGSVVTKDVEKFTVVMGNPAKYYSLVCKEEIVDYLIPYYPKEYEIFKLKVK